MIGGNDFSNHLVLSILIVFGSAKLLAELFERLGQPGIVGEILAGVLLGPSVLNWIEPNEVMLTLAEIGLIFLLFQVGLEIKTTELLRVGGTSAMTAIFGVVVPFFTAWGVCALWGRPRIESIFVGAAMTATSVGITAQVLAARGVLSRTASQIILGAAVIDDVLALLVLGAVSAVAHTGVNLLELILTPVFAAVFVIVVVKWGGRTASAVLRRSEGRFRIGHEAFVLTIILVFGLAALSERAGVAAITGAFLAGTAVSGVLPEEVRKHTHGIGDLFVPFFLAGIGLTFDPGVFTNQSTVWFAALLLLTAILSKVIGCGLGSARHGFQVAKRVGLGMIPRGEFCVVSAQIGLRLKVIRPDMYAVVVFVAVATTMLAPPLIQATFPKESVDEELAATEPEW